MTHLLSGLATIPPILTYLFVFVWLAVESTGLPLPNELILLLAGSLTAQAGASLSPVLLVLLATLGSLAGALTAYTIGLRGGRAAVLRFGRRFGLNEQRLDGVEAWFARSGIVAIFLSRITPFVRTVASFPAGMLRFPRMAFLMASFLGSLLWCVVMVTLGHIFGRNYTVALHFIEEYTIPAILILVALGAGYFWLHGRLARVGQKPLTQEQITAMREREKR